MANDQRADDADPWAIMRADELATSATERSGRGAWYTPRPVAETVTSMAFATDRLPEFVIDPTCGGGAFLLTALDALVAAGQRPEEALGRVAGLDIDSGAVDTARRVVGRWADRHGVAPRPDLVRVGDALGPWPSAWPAPDLILGNPPFASPLRSAGGGAGLPSAADAFRRRHRAELGPYADLAAIHLLNAAQRLDPSVGRMALVVPQSVLAGRDAAPLRAWLAGHLPLEQLWITEEKVFDASVLVCAPVLDRRATASSLSWAEVAAHHMGIPDPGVDRRAERLGSICTATAGFRDEYYGLSQACVEGTPDDRRRRLATVGSIDPLVSYWGDRPTRLAKRGWRHPVVEEARLPRPVLPWFRRQCSPKVLVPTQARILEPFVDRSGQVIPVTPLLSVSAPVGALDRVAALLLAPSVVAWSARRSFGAALSSRAIKLRARDVLDLPLPPDTAAWDAAAALVPQGPSAVDSIAEQMHVAFGADPTVLEWWRERRSGVGRPPSGDGTHSRGPKRESG